MADLLNTALVDQRLTLGEWNTLVTTEAKDPQQKTALVATLLAKSIVIDQDAMDAMASAVDVPAVIGKLGVVNATLVPPNTATGTGERADVVRHILYKPMHSEARKELLTLYSQGLRTLKELGIEPGKHVFGEPAGHFFNKLLQLRDDLQTQGFDKSVLGQTLRSLGCDNPAVLDQLWSRTGELGAGSRQHSAATLKLAWQLYDGGVHLADRLEVRRAEVAEPFDAAKQPAQTFALLADFPDLSAQLYQDRGFSRLVGFPPQLKTPGVLPTRPDELAFYNDASRWQTKEQVFKYGEMAGLLVAGIAITVASGGAGGAAAGVAAGAVFGVGVSSAQVLDASHQLQLTRDAYAVHAGSAAEVHYKENELVAAYGGLLINVVTLGIGGKLGAGEVAGAALKATLPQLAREGLTAVALGAGSGAATAMVNPNVWESDHTLALIAEGTLIGGVGGAVGGALGIGAGKLSEPKITVAIPRGEGPVAAGTKVSVLAEGGKPVVGVVKRVAGDTLVLDVKGKDVKVKLAELRSVTGSDAVKKELVSKGQSAKVEAFGARAGEPTTQLSAHPLAPGTEVELCARSVAAKGHIVGYDGDKTIIETTNGFGEPVQTRIATDELWWRDLGDGGPPRLAKGQDTEGTGMLMQPRTLTPCYDAKVIDVGVGHYAVSKPVSPETLPDYTSPLTFRPLGALDHNDAFVTESLQRPGTRMIGVDGQPKTNFKDVAVFQGHGVPSGFAMANADIVKMVAAEIRAHNAEPGATPIRYLLLDACQQGDPAKLFGLFGKTNAAALQALLDKELGTGVVTILAADRPGALVLGDRVEVKGGYEQVEFVPVTKQEPVKHLSTGKKVARATVVAVGGGAALGGAKVIGALATPNEKK